MRSTYIATSPHASLFLTAQPDGNFTLTTDARGIGIQQTLAPDAVKALLSFLSAPQEVSALAVPPLLPGQLCLIRTPASNTTVPAIFVEWDSSLQLRARVIEDNAIRSYPRNHIHPAPQGVPQAEATCPRPTPLPRPAVGSWVHFNPTPGSRLNRTALAGLLMQVTQDDGSVLPLQLRAGDDKGSLTRYTWAELSEVTPWAPALGDTVALGPAKAADLRFRFKNEARFSITALPDTPGGMLELTPVGLRRSRNASIEVALADICPTN